MELVGLEDMVATDDLDMESDLLLAVASDLRSDERGAGGDVSRVRGALFAHGSSQNGAGEASVGASGSGILLDALAVPVYLPV